MKVRFLDIHLLQNFKTHSLGFSAVDDDGKVVLLSGTDKFSKDPLLGFGMFFDPVLIQANFTNGNQAMGLTVNEVDFRIHVEWLGAGNGCAHVFWA